jgi:non-homologous end joining protein Ku
MPQRALWNGFLKLSLVSCPVALFAATAAEKRLSFRRVNRTTGNALRQQLVDAVTGESVPRAETARGYEMAADSFLLVEDEELEEARIEARERPFSSPEPQGAANQTNQSAMREKGAGAKVGESHSLRPPRASSTIDDDIVPAAAAVTPPIPRPINTRSIDLDRFIDRDDIDLRFIDSPYYIVPRDETAEEAFAVVREAMREREMAGMGRVILQKRERPIVIVPRGKGMIGLTLRYSHEIRDEAEYFGAIPDINLPDDMVEMAALLIDRKAGEFHPAFLEDRYRTVMVEHLRQKSGSASPARRPAKPHDQNVIDLMAALKRSVGQRQAGDRSTADPPSTRRAAARAKGPATKKSRGGRR